MTTKSNDRTPAEQLVALSKVQRRVASIGFFAVAIHGVLGLIVVAEVVMGEGRSSDAALLLVMSGVFAILTYVVIRLILGAKVWSPWSPLSLIPTVIGIFWVF